MPQKATVAPLSQNTTIITRYIWILRGIVYRTAALQQKFSNIDEIFIKGFKLIFW